MRSFSIVSILAFNTMIVSEVVTICNRLELQEFFPIMNARINPTANAINLI